MPASLNEDAVAYLKQQKIPLTTSALNRAMNLMNEQPNLRPSYANQTDELDVDVDTMKPIRSSSLPPLQNSPQDDGDFGSAFAAARKAQGANGQFDWRGKKYSTKYKEEVDKFGPDTSDGDRRGPRSGISEEFNNNTDIDLEADADVRSRLTDEKLGNEDGSSAGPVKTRANYNDQEDDDMDALLTALGVGAGAAGAGALAYGMRKGPQIPQQMSRTDLYGRSPEPGVMSDADLYGGPDKTQKMTDADVFADEQTRKMVPDDIQMSLIDEFEQDIKAGNFIPEEEAAVRALKSGDKQAARTLLQKLKQLKGDPRLITALKGII